jgi:hypothetical protein
MKRKRILIGGMATMLLVIVFCLTSLLYAMRQVPDFYVLADDQLPARQIRREQAKQLEKRTVEIVERLEASTDGWSESFEQQQINSWLVEALPNKHSKRMPRGVKDPRVVLESDRVQIGFKLIQKTWSGIISVVVRPKVPTPNSLELHIESVSAGLVALPYERFLPQINRALDRSKLPYEWSETDDGIRVLHLSLVEKLKQQTIESIAVEDERITINGRRLDDSTEDFHFRQVVRQIGFVIQ